MKLRIEPRCYTKARIKVTVTQHETKLMLPAGMHGAFADRLNVFVLQVTTECRQHSNKTMRGEIGLDETTGKMVVTMSSDSGKPRGLAVPVAITIKE